MGPVGTSFKEDLIRQVFRHNIRFQVTLMPIKIHILKYITLYFSHTSRNYFEINLRVTMTYTKIP